MKKHFLAVAICSCLNAQAIAETATDVTDNNRVQLNNIVVEGENQSRSLKDTAASVAVIGADELNSTQHQNLRDAISSIPNVVIQTGVVPNVRGVTGNGAAGGFNSISGGANARFNTIIDGVAQPFVADFTGDSGLWDLEQIEVYRGPQSTNHGRNSIAGAMYINTKDPTFDWDGAVRLGYRNKDQYFDKALMLSGPIIDNVLAFRFAGQLVDGETITSNDKYETNPSNIDLNELDTRQGRAKLLWTPTDAFEALLTYSNYNEEGDAGRRYFVNDGTENYNKIEGLIRDMDTETEITSLKMRYQLSDNSSLDFLIAKMDYQLGFDSYDPAPADKQNLLYNDENKTVDVKFNFGEGSHALNGFVGLDYFKRDQDVKSTGSYQYTGDDTADSKAVYSEVNFGLTDKLVLTGGLRYQKESQERHFIYGAIDSNLDENNTIWLPKIALSYDLTETNRVGASARKGYNSSGGALDAIAGEYYYYDDERVNTYEFFTRNEFDDGRYSLNTNVFFNDYDGYQGLANRHIVNIDKAETYGAEIEGIVWVQDDLEINVSLGLLHTEVVDGGDDYPGVDGNELSSAPKKTANIGARYYLTDNFDVGGNLQYVGGYYADIENSEEQKIGGYSVINLRANYKIGQLALAAYINNVTDKYAKRVDYPADARYPQGYMDVIDPRHVGVSATYSFF
ncbi:TonB-dependent receptor [Methylophaga nitratireducenticrescens]|uniref:TonB-dependent receptor n=1 Tax=Methylophaga nitratireducenticrescens TaxID=754476 RepID=I1XJH8_METNJ|nr:TonB-dependent receptor [Methylophaga nitratireducenticrescens]AFI84547.1 TonB-dependent receptor [Methylophaga nitratireducenticrescens]